MISEWKKAMKDDQTELVVIGISHKTSTVQDREILQIDRKNIGPALDYFKALPAVKEVVIISTCNRLEFYFVIEKDCEIFSLLEDFYSGKIKEIPSKLFYKYKDVDAASHLFRVIAGLDSMILGEYQVQGQIKDAYSIACSEKTAGTILHKLFHAAFRTGKSIRSQTKIGNGNQSVSGIASKILKIKLGKTDYITIIGVNQNTRIIAKELYDAGFINLVFVNRTLFKAEELAEKYKGRAFNLECLEQAILSSKCIISSTGAPGFIIDSHLLNRIYLQNKQLKLLIDIALPRDINTEGLTKEIEVIDLEGLKKYLAETRKDVAEDIPAAERIIADEVKVFAVWSEYCKNTRMSMIEEKIELLRLQVLNEMKTGISEDEVQLLDKFSHSLVHRMKSTINQAVNLNLVESDIQES
jgi:glutamyl-tRNA reductase